MSIIFSPAALPVSESFVPEPTEAQRLAEYMALLGYPGYAYLRPHVAKRNPGEVLLTALSQNNLESRLVEALPWLLLRYWEMDFAWVVEYAKKFDLQNRLGFVVSLASQSICGKSTKRAPNSCIGRTGIHVRSEPTCPARMIF